MLNNTLIIADMFQFGVQDNLILEFELLTTVFSAFLVRGNVVTDKDFSCKNSKTFDEKMAIMGMTIIWLMINVKKKCVCSAN